MSNIDLQSVIALGSVTIAALYLSGRVFAAMMLRKSSGCAGGCSKCPVGEGSDSVAKVEIIPIEQLARSLRQRD